MSYQVIYNDLPVKTFANKNLALKLAKTYIDQGRTAWVLCVKTGKTTRILPRQLCSCMVCGNELQGKRHCPLCGQLHYYA